VFSILYNVAVEITWRLLQVFSLFNSRINDWVKVRKNLWKQVPTFKNPTIWCHISSLGEYEQVLPLLEYLKKFSKETIVLSFFSPSGYNIVKKKDQWPYVYYLPIDRKRDVVKWYNSINPGLIIYVKYDLWHQFLKEGFERKIPTMLVSALFTENKFYFKWYGAWMLEHLKKMDMIFVQNEKSLRIAEKYGLSAMMVGDTRVDRSLALPLETFSDRRIEKFCKDKKVMIWASTHKKDEDLLMSWWEMARPEGWRILWAPHHVDKENILRIESSFNGTVELHSNIKAGKPIMVMDSMGVLKYIYRYADLVYVGGGFGSGVHNLLEPMSYAVPCIFGPNFRAFPEAVYLVENEIGYSADTLAVLEEVFDCLKEDAVREKLGNESFKYMSDNKGATERIALWISQNDILNE
jgi:3-deoxy-D-manno-octulosonic-acid transferase